jgi:hypothetical protein
VIAIILPYVEVTFCHELCRLGVLALSEQGQMSALYNFNLTPHAPLQLAQQITRFTAMIFETYEPLTVH